MKQARRWFLTPCGLDCYFCSIRLRTDEELEYWRTQGVDPKKIRCNGCRSDRSGDHWDAECKILQCCVYDRKHEFCAECPYFPCAALEDWGKQYEHHAKAVKRLHDMKQTGIEKWLGIHGPSKNDTEAD